MGSRGFLFHLTDNFVQVSSGYEKVSFSGVLRAGNRMFCLTFFLWLNYNSRQGLFRSAMSAIIVANEKQVFSRQNPRVMQTARFHSKTKFRLRSRLFFTFSLALLSFSLLINR